MITFSVMADAQNGVVARALQFNQATLFLNFTYMLTMNLGDNRLVKRFSLIGKTGGSQSGVYVVKLVTNPLQDR